MAVWERRRDCARRRWITILDANGVARKVRDEHFDERVFGTDRSIYLIFVLMQDIEGSKYPDQPSERATRFLGVRGGEQ
jgi:hypothetical protein